MYKRQTKDLVNTERTKNNLNILSYSEKATTSSRKHSEDMMIKNYFDHTNKENKSPFDRMEEEGINYKNAGENIAAGQSSAIYAHHAWMNSLGPVSYTHLINKLLLDSGDKYITGQISKEQYIGLINTINALENINVDLKKIIEQAKRVDEMYQEENIKYDTAISYINTASIINGMVNSCLLYTSRCV